MDFSTACWYLATVWHHDGVFDPSANARSLSAAALSERACAIHAADSSMTRYLAPPRCFFYEVKDFLTDRVGVQHLVVVRPHCVDDFLRSLPVFIHRGLELHRGREDHVQTLVKAGL